ncbi:hypothetical protein BJX70DRAFT_397826 [Aspergillus crustosus]
MEVSTDNPGDRVSVPRDGDTCADPKPTLPGKPMRNERDHVAPLRKRLQPSEIPQSSTKVPRRNRPERQLPKALRRRHAARVPKDSSRDMSNPPLDQIVFESNWELPLIISDRRLTKPTTSLSETITLTRSEQRVEMMPCITYVRKHYGEDGMALVTKIFEIVENNEECYHDEHQEIHASVQRLSVSLRSSHSELWDLLLWLCMTFRVAKEGQISISTCKIIDTKTTLQALSPATAGNTSCWFNLFQKGIIAQDPRLNTSSVMYLEANLDLMCALADLEWPTIVEDGVVLMGWSTALIPMLPLDDDTIIWHLEVADPPSRLKPTSLLGTKGFWLKTTLENLQSREILLGWRSQSRTLLGSGELGRVRLSGAKVKTSTMKLAGINIAASNSLVGLQANMCLERQMHATSFAPSASYLMSLINGVTEQIVLYDVGSSRAWLVPQICVLHEMLLAYWQMNPMQHGTPDKPLADPSPNGAKASLDALKGCGHVVVNQGSDNDNLTVRHLILHFATTLDNATLVSPRRNEIYGYEFMDIVKGSSRSLLKRVCVTTEGRAWIGLLENVKCIFCSGVGEVIIGSTTTATSALPCDQLHKGSDLLAASMHSIETLSSFFGGQSLDGTYQLFTNRHWLMTGTPFGGCKHETDDSSSCWETGAFLQQIRRRAPKPRALNHTPLEDHPDGAVAFGLINRDTKMPNLHSLRVDLESIVL